MNRARRQLDDEGDTAQCHWHQIFGRWEQQADTIDACGRWGRWVAAQPALAEVSSAYALGEVVTDQAQPARANELLLALVRVGSVDGGVDETAATFVASLLVPGGNRIIRSLTSLGPDVDDVVGGQLWLQVRDYPWRTRPRAVAKNALMETRRAVLADYGATTARRATLVPVAPSDLVEAVEQRCISVTGWPVADLALLQLLIWARARGVLESRDAALLWELVLAGDEQAAAAVPAGLARGVSSVHANVSVAAARGVTCRTVERQRDRVVDLLRLVRDDFEISSGSGVEPEGVPMLTGIGPTSRKGTDA